MEKYKNLLSAISIFTEEQDLSKEQTIGILDSDIKQGYINYLGLKEELEMALLDSNFNWVDFAINSKLIVYDIEKYNNDNIKSYVKSLIGNYLYSDNI
jgi:hypothetical protein